MTLRSHQSGASLVELLFSFTFGQSFTVQLIRLPRTGRCRATLIPYLRLRRHRFATSAVRARAFRYRRGCQHQHLGLESNSAAGEREEPPSLRQVSEKPPPLCTYPLKLHQKLLSGPLHVSVPARTHEPACAYVCTCTHAHVWNGHEQRRVCARARVHPTLRHRQLANRSPTPGATCSSGRLCQRIARQLDTARAERACT